jgi:GNAT superfamily N-acetyltransferase
MSRAAVRVRPAVAADIAALVALWDQLQASARDPLLARARIPEPLTDAAGSRLTALLDNPLARVVVAEDRAGDIVGMALLAAEQFGEFFEVSAVHLSHLVVHADHRRRGVGHALLAAAAAFAEESSVDQLVVSVPPSLREAHRFFARLGFVPLVSRRVASVSVLRRRLTDGGSNRLDALVRRRTLAVRRRGVGVRPFGDGGGPVGDGAGTR